MATFFPLLSLPLLLLYFSSSFHAATGQNLIHDTCKRISQDDPDINLGFCTTSLQAAPASRCAALHGLGSISIRLVQDNVTDTRCDIKQMLGGKNKIDPYTKQCLEDCFELYSDAIPSTKRAMKLYNHKRYEDANIEISSVMDSATTCEDGFREKKGVVSPLTKRNDDTFQLSAMVLSIMHVLQSGS